MNAKFDDYQEQINLSKYVAGVVNSYRVNKPENYLVFSRWFHLRPCTSYVTIVTTHGDRPMRGIAVAKTKLESAMDYLVEFIGNDELDWSKPTVIDKNKKGFDIGSPNNEFPYQARMINNLREDAKLKKLLGVRQLNFIASEVVFARGKEDRKRIDIVAHDDAGRIVFFELKAPGSNDDPVTQVNEYLFLYGKGGSKNEVFEAMIKNYPQGLISEIREFVGYGVIGYSEDPTLDGQLVSCK